MRSEVFYAKDIDEAAERILQEINVLGARQRNKVIYFDGWDGLGASAVLREVGRRLTDVNVGTGRGDVPKLLRVLHVDCSKWESRRALQRSLAMQLKLPATLMELFDARDEDDDYLGVAEGSRAVIPDVVDAIAQHVQSQGIAFVVIFHNGSDEEVDLDSLGFPLSGEYSRHKVLWSFQGRFRLYPRAKVDAALKKTTSTTATSLFLSANYNEYNFDLIGMMRREAKELMHDINLCAVVDSPASTAANCLLYMTKLCRTSNDLTDYDLAAHSFHYCICDGVIQPHQQGDVDNDGADDRLWLWSEALQREMRLDTDYYQNPHFSSPVPVKRFLKDRIAFWASPTYGFVLIPESKLRRIHQGMFLPFDGLSVLKLYDCVFSFKSPPFLCCHSLRFLWIDGCECQEEKDEEAASEEDLRRCFQRLWVLHVRNTSAFLSAKMMGFLTQVRELNVTSEYKFGLFQGQLPNVRKLRLEKLLELETESLPLGTDKLELLSFRGYIARMKRFPVVSGSRSLATVIIQGEQGHHDYLEDISLKGCANLKNLFLSGWFTRLQRLDISGTAVKTLDLSEVEIPMLDELFLFDCGNLCAILWPSPDSRWTNLGHLGIDTIGRDDHHDAGRSPPWPTGFAWYIAARDARLLRSIEPLKDDLDRNNVHLDISTIMLPSSLHTSDADAGKQEVQVANYMQQQQLQSNHNNATICADFAAALTFKDDNSMQQQQANKGDSEPPDVMYLCPPPPCFPPSQGFYVHLEDHQMKSSQAASITVSGLICDSSKILHVHDSPSISSILPSSSDPIVWRQLEWCRVERCPKLKWVFSGSEPQKGPVFDKLRTIWASCLPNAGYIWKSSGDPPWTRKLESTMVLKSPWSILLESVMSNLTLLHLDRCPRLIDAVSVQTADLSLRSLETLEITFCGDLNMIFRQPRYSPTDSRTWEFPVLKRIHLHELPMLRYICCGDIEWDVIAPKLETVKIRGCWSLKRLPYVGGKNMVLCDCEKEWWDALKWDSKDHAESYKPTHPRYYKKKMLRGSALR